MTDTAQLALPFTAADWKPGYRTCPACGEQTPCACCQLWPGMGYGKARWGPPLQRTPDRGLTPVHRAVYEAAHGPVPERGQVMHICDTPACYFLPHLVLGTLQLNVADRDAKGRGWRRIKAESIEAYVASLPEHHLGGDDAS